MTENPFSFERILNYIETEKQVALTEKKFRLVHSDQSGQLLKSNSVKQSFSRSFLSPTFSHG